MGEKDEAYYKAEALAFVRSIPSYQASRENMDKMFDWLQANKLDLSRETLAQAFKHLFVN
jgi:hypothetical protein